MERLLSGGGSYLSASERVATFGLGSASGVDSLVVYWPSGRVDRWQNVNGGQDILLVEGTGQIRPISPESTAEIFESR